MIDISIRLLGKHDKRYIVTFTWLRGESDISHRPEKGCK